MSGEFKAPLSEVQRELQLFHRGRGLYLLLDMSYVIFTLTVTGRGFQIGNLRLKRFNRAQLFKGEFGIQFEV